MSWYNPEGQSSTPPPQPPPPPPPSPPAQSPPAGAGAPGQQDRGGWQPRNVGLSPSYGGPKVPPGPQAPAGPTGPTVPPGPAGAREGSKFLASPLAIATAVLGLAYLASAWFNWVSFEGEGASAYDGPLKFLIDNTAEPGGPSIGLTVFALGLLVAVTSLVRPVRYLASVFALAALAVAVVFVVQVQLLVGDLNDLGLDLSLGDFLGAGAYVGLVAALAAVAVSLASAVRARS